MATEILSVPEDHLLEVIGVIRAGLAAKPETTDEVREQLSTWCDEEEAYMQGEDSEPPRWVPCTDNPHDD